MICPKCGGEMRSIDVVPNDENDIYRKRQCNRCKHQFFTVEYEVLLTPRFKNDWYRFRNERVVKSRERNKK